MSRKSGLAIARAHADEALLRSDTGIGQAAAFEAVSGGTFTLAAGTHASIPVPSITAQSVVVATLALANASTALGTMSIVITPSTGFVPTSLIDGTPGSTQTGDLGTYRYLVFNPIP